MRHKYGYNKLGRKSSHRKAMLRNMATALVNNERITTTLPKAKELRSVVEKLVTMGKKGVAAETKEAGVHYRRLARKVLFDRGAVQKVFDDLAPRMEKRPGGYTRILRRGIRFGDGAHMATIEFVDYEPKKKDSEESK